MSNSKTRHRSKQKKLKQLHFYCVLIAQVIVSAILIAIALWLFIRFPEPQVHLTEFDVDALDKNVKNRTLLHYNFTLHNPDLYKSIHYDVLVLRMTYYTSTSYHAIVNFDVDGKGIDQSPRETTLLANHTLNYTVYEVGWENEGLMKLKTAEKWWISIWFVMEFKYKVFGKELRSRQMMQTVDLYFDDNGKAFIDPRAGLILN